MGDIYVMRVEPSRMDINTVRKIAHRAPSLLLTSENTVSTLHRYIQTANFQRFKLAFPCPITEVSSRVWGTL